SSHYRSLSCPPTLSLHDALPICSCRRCSHGSVSRSVSRRQTYALDRPQGGGYRPSAHLRTESTSETDTTWMSLRVRRNNPANTPDRKSTRLNSSHQIISYAVFCF